MKTHACIIIITAFAMAACSNKSPLPDWQQLQLDVREERVDKEKGTERLRAINSELKDYAEKNYTFEESKWAYPLSGYSWTKIYKKDFAPNAYYGPYRTKGYEFFSGNKHGGHPAFDVFIKDLNQDSLDDKTKKLVNAVSMTDALVISICYEWEPGSKLRGGKYVWTYNPKEEKYFYYAHLRNVLVQPGQFVKKGGILGTVGRTGLLAAMKRSPTHVHLMVLQYKGGEMTPFNFYDKIKR